MRLKLTLIFPLKSIDTYVVHVKLSVLYVAGGWGVGQSLFWFTKTGGDTLSLQDPVASLILSDCRAGSQAANLPQGLKQIEGLLRHQYQGVLYRKGWGGPLYREPLLHKEGVERQK